MFRRALRGKYTLVAGRVSEIRTMEGGGGGGGHHARLMDHVVDLFTDGFLVHYSLNTGLNAWLNALHPP